MGIFTAVLAGATLLLWWSTRRLVTGGEKTAKQELRAYVAVEHVRVDQYGASNETLAVIQLKNFGQTPAYKLRITADIGIAPSFDALRDLNLDRPSSGHLAPSGGISMGLALPAPSPEIIMGVAEGGARVFVHGIIQYRDAFGTAHFTRFRTMNAGPILTVPMLLSSCQQGNDTDDDVALAEPTAA